MHGQHALAFRFRALSFHLCDVALSSGSACASARGEPSHVLTALGLPPALARASLRFLRKVETQRLKALACGVPLAEGEIQHAQHRRQP